jgi:transcriptional regulator with XRE-family HTH domain
MDDERDLKKDNTRKRNAKSNYNARHSEEIADYNITFTERLKTAREAQKLTQTEAAEKLDISVATYKKYEQVSGNRNDIAYFIGTLANTFDVSADYLIGKSDTPHPEYNDVIKTTGLNEKSIHQLQQLYKQDGAEISQGYLDFINCFLGNDKCTALFFQKLMPLLRNLDESMNGEYPSTRMTSALSVLLTDCIFDYLTKVVIPTYGQLYNTGKYDTPDTERYLTDEAVFNRKRK